jgi:hypothetical protein
MEDDIRPVQGIMLSVLGGAAVWVALLQLILHR